MAEGETAEHRHPEPAEAVSKDVEKGPPSIGEVIEAAEQAQRDAGDLVE